MSAPRNPTWRAVLAALVVAIGFAVVWAVALSWLGSTGASLLRSKDRVYEDISVAADGTPVICVESSALVNTVTVSRRTLDGQSWPLDYEYWQGGAYLTPRNFPPGVIELPLPWSAWAGRMIGGTDGRRPPTAWYLIRGDELVSRCYLAGFDAFSKLPVGYIGRNGFRATAPAPEDRFQLPATYEPQLNNMAESSQYLRWGLVWDHNLYRDGDPAPWLVFLLEADRMWEIDLRERTARVVLDANGLISASAINALQSTVQALRTDGQAAQRQGSSFRLAAAGSQEVTGVFRAQTAPANVPDERPEFAGAVAVRTDERVVIYDPVSGNNKEFLLPEQVPNQSIRVSWIAPDQLLVLYSNGYWSGGPLTHVLWINPAGEVERDEEVKLAGGVPEPPRSEAWMASAAMPVPLLWLVGMTVGTPLYMIQNYQAPDYASALWQVFGIAWPPLVVVLLVSLALAWLVVRRQRKYRRPATAVWAAFLFLLGVPGFVAYWLEHRRPRLEACAECGAVVPRNRDACAACNAAFPSPPPVGTEIFA